MVVCESVGWSQQLQTTLILMHVKRCRASRSGPRVFVLDAECEVVCEGLSIDRMLLPSLANLTQASM